MTTPVSLVALGGVGVLAALVATRIILRAIAQGSASQSEIEEWASRLGFVRASNPWGASQDLVGIYRGQSCVISQAALGGELGSVAPLIQIRVGLDATARLPAWSPTKGGPIGSIGTGVEPLDVRREKGWLGTESQLRELESQLQTQSIGHLRCLDDELVYSIGEFDVPIYVLQDALDLMIETLETARRFEPPRGRVN